ncbi:MAG: helix-turn-helix transcriptional regulator [Magnetococcales bacterium]|nr:helix-turn-helix transcriptional regulator [Magnetococcales bacterium]MBF0148661.1 helix-turn-helix transcriptional regulator [Magnetococcales bacterium]MBF0174092.1 helix-turn-helix transcriptional regulator [Magnetococcales bacterium]MBF0346842.1 helix-turn-helix transcriptional regulator [Magnetococcales bacterium]MBF0631467.1 helix-turn-helix transcriptional regulator [Magnetococcales bacterium]
MTQCHELHALAALRRSLGVSQEEMAGRLGIGQAAISKIENREDPQLHSLKRYCEALGGRLKLVVEFPASPLPAPMPVTAPDPSV